MRGTIIILLLSAGSSYDPNCYNGYKPCMPAHCDRDLDCTVALGETDSGDKVPTPAPLLYKDGAHPHTHAYQH